MPQLDKETIERLIQFRDRISLVLTLVRIQATSHDGDLAWHLRGVAKDLEAASWHLNWAILLGSAEGDDETSLSDNL